MYMVSFVDKRDRWGFAGGENLSPTAFVPCHVFIRLLRTAGFYIDQTHIMGPCGVSAGGAGSITGNS